MAVKNYYWHDMPPYPGAWNGQTLPAAGRTKNGGLGDILASSLVAPGSMAKTAIVLASAYHGYKRYGKAVYGIGFAVAAMMEPIVTGGVVAYQSIKKGGFAKKA